MKMSLKSRKELVKKAKGRYLQAERFEKTTILNELFENTGLNRNYLIQMLSAKVDLSFASPINRKGGKPTTPTLSTISKKYGPLSIIPADRGSRRCFPNISRFWKNSRN
ncbi:MAG: hypothetical protein A2184_03590 [Candidatus Moranbacteria bacterium RIFOXYA1_FULL_44_7]|nr:MAG: hypothetical protein A2184_03590 [Candidatus Moranbacteria bacterium RIFOXYA1_FULL_44_7]